MKKRENSSGKLEYCRMLSYRITDGHTNRQTDATGNITTQRMSLAANTEPLHKTKPVNQQAV